MSVDIRLAFFQVIFGLLIELIFFCQRTFCDLLSIEQYFQSYGGSTQEIKVRGQAIIKANISSARLYVDAHQKKRFIIAVKYQDEQEARYLVASDMSWRTMDIVQAYTLRWLAEVFFEDWKLTEGWGQLTKQFDVDGSSRGLILSLLLDHCLLTHPQQLARLKNKLPASTVGSLINKSRFAFALYPFFVC